jgi:hypothetical protein
MKQSLPAISIDLHADPFTRGENYLGLPNFPVTPIPIEPGFPG